jgi:hypothetical protein
LDFALFVSLRFMQNPKHQPHLPCVRLQGKNI